MKRPPFQMLNHRRAVLTCDDKFVTAGRASFVWETFLMRRTAGVPGVHRIRDGRRGAPWHQVNWTVEEAENDLTEFLGRFSRVRLEKAIRTRHAREERGLPVA